MRLQVFLSHNGVASRRKAMDIIQDGRVTVDGRLVREPSFDVDGSERVLVDGQAVAPKTFSYVMINKPAGYTTTKEDVHAEKTVMDLLPPQLQHLSPVGRLDRDTEGLLLLTNDGDLALRLTHPRYHFPKTYEVHLGSRLKDEEKNKLERGIVLDETKTAPSRISNVRRVNEQTQLTMTITEGRKRQIRRMFATVGHKVVFLKRIAIGTLALGTLASGQWRELNPKELDRFQTTLRSSVTSD